MDKAQRQAYLVEIIQKRKVSSQDELLLRLKAKGVAAGQATVSRDMRELGVSKKNNRYYIDQAPSLSENSWEVLFSERINKVSSAGPNILVVKGVLGCAPIISMEIESLNWPEIVGVIAGDDTLFFAFKTEKELKSIKKRFNELVSKKKKRI